MIRVTRSQPAPASLAKQKTLASGKYNLPDVVERLKADFHNKCYLCEESRISAVEVEHLQPHREDPKLKFDWANLFYCCRHCNGTKKDMSAWPILDCTDHTINVLSRLRHTYTVNDMRDAVVVEPTEDDPTTGTTARLLTRIYGGTTPIRGIEAENILEKIQDSCRGFFRVVSDLASSKGSPEARERWRDRISRELAPETGFTAIRAWYVIRHGLAEQFRKELERLGFAPVGHSAGAVEPSSRR